MRKKNDKPVKKTTINLEITELFMARANDWKRTFVGTLTREKDENGNEIAIHSKLVVNNCKVWAMAPTFDLMGEYNDDAAVLILDYKIHEMKGVKSLIAGNEFSHN
jgi:hypothetical protein